MRISARLVLMTRIVFVPILAAGVIVGSVAASSGAAGAAAGRSTRAVAGGHAAVIKKSKPPCQDWTGYSEPPSPSSAGESPEKLDGVAVAGPCDAWAVGAYGTLSCSGARSLIEHWNGLTWTLVPSPDPGGCGNTVLTGVAISKDVVWAVGYYFNGTANQALVLRLNHGSSTWVQEQGVLDPGGASADNQLSGVTVDGDNVWVSGQYNAGTSTRTLVETASFGIATTQDKNTWVQVKTSNPSGKAGNDVLNGVTSAGKDVWAVGAYGPASPSATMIELCQRIVKDFKTTYSCRTQGVTGSKVVAAGAIIKGVLTAVAADSPKNAWAVGYGPGPKGAQYLLAERWNGKAWGRLLLKPPGSDAEFSGVAVLGSHVWAVGSYDLGNDSLLEYTASGPQWFQLPSPNTGNDQLMAAAADPAGGVWAVGQYGNDSGYNLIAIHD